MSSVAVCIAGQDGSSSVPCSVHIPAQIDIPSVRLCAERHDMARINVSVAEPK